MSGVGSSAVSLLVRVTAVFATLVIACAGCGAVEAGGREGNSQGESIRADEVISRLPVVPIARQAIQDRLPKSTVTDVACTSEVMYVSEGSMTNCTARVDNVPSGWILTFRDADGAYQLARRPGPPWKFATG
jgi:hypothetical protein